MLTLVQNVLRLNSIKGNIVLALVAMGSFTLMLTISSHWWSHQLEANQRKIEQELEPALSSLKSTEAGLSKSLLALTAYLETGKESHLKEWKQLWEQEIKSNLYQPGSAGKQEVHNLLTQDAQKLNQLLKEILEKQEQIVSTIQLEQRSNQNTSLVDSAVTIDYKVQLRSSINITLRERNKEAAVLASTIGTKIENQVADLQGEQKAYLNLIRNTSLAVFVLCVLGGVCLGYFLIVQIIRSLYHVKLILNELSNGNLPTQVRQSRNETNHLIKEIGRLTENLRNVRHFAKQVGNGKFDNDIAVFKNEGDLGTSLASMRESLFKVAQEDNQRNWVNEGYTIFGDILRTHNNSIVELCDVTLSKLVKYVGANQGAVFMVETIGEQKQEALVMKSCYAYDRKKYVGKEILKGEGLCGQAWQEEDIIHINDVPKDYVNIRSGLGGANPTDVLVVPLFAQEKAQGVLELASFKNFEEYQVAFISKIAENLAAAIATTKNNERTGKLLEEFQEMTEEMRAQEEEMRQNMEELQATQEEMERAKLLIERKEQNLNSVINNTTDTIFAIDQHYRITVVNKVLADKYRKLGIDLQEGTLISDVLPRSAWEIWKPRYDRALAGEQYSLIEESTGSGGSRFSQTYHNPIRNDEGDVIGVSVISRDVTDTLAAQKEAEHKRFIISSLIDNTDDTYFAIDTNYKILIANKTLKDRFATSNIILEEGDFIFDKLPKDQHASWKERYDRALAGESFQLVAERQVNDKTLTIEVHHHPIIDAAGKVIGATVSSKDITRWQSSLAQKEEQEKELEKLRKLVGMQQSAKDMVLNRAVEQKNEKEQ